MASKGHFLTQMPQPMQSSSEMNASLEAGATSMQSLPIRTTGHCRLHSCRHFFGLHLSFETIAMRVKRSSGLSSFFCDFGGIFRNPAARNPLSASQATGDAAPEKPPPEHEQRKRPRREQSRGRRSLTTCKLKSENPWGKPAATLFMSRSPFVVVVGVERRHPLAERLGQRLRKRRRFRICIAQLA
ncbi:hypothetical protein M885DRAFT_448901 [Pelagophyceae sp. CCMP2097]|nr:hypothetical protein M885DRAFT_448901 [Pelagophyceae sp. CCMP2097]